MSIRHLDRIFRPKSVAVVGATERAGSVGSAVLRNLLGGGFAGVVYPVNPGRTSVHGVHAYPSVSDLPGPTDLAVVCTPRPTVPGIVEQCGAAGVKGMVVLTAGFGETGAAGQTAERELAAAVREAGVRMVGPNCLGIIVPKLGLNATFAADMPAPGRLAFLSQSGALCTAVLDWAAAQGIGFSHFVSVGNMLDVDFGDLIDYLGADEATRALLLYIESISDARKFLSAARAFARTKPILAYKAGRFAESAQAASSHTGALAGQDDVYDAAFRRAGIERVFRLQDLFDSAELLARHLAPPGPRLAIVTNAGGPGVIATDALIDRGGKLATLAPETIESLNGLLPPHWSHGNPVDVLGDASAERLVSALRIVLEDPGVDAALVVLAPQAMTDPTDCAKAVAQEVRGSRKPVLAAWMGGRRMEAGLDVLGRAGLPAYPQVEDAIDGFMHLVSYARNLEILYETPRDLPTTFRVEKERHRTLLEPDPEPRTLSEEHSKALLEAYGIVTTGATPAGSAAQAVELARTIGYPVVLKVLSPQITHKSDVGGVVLDLDDDEDVRAAFDRIVRNARAARPDAEVTGVTVQRMADLSRGHELILGMKRDRVFGAAILVGAGGTAVELLDDRAVELPPLNERLAGRMLQRLRIWSLLRGYRDRPPADIDGLIETLVRFSYLVADNPTLAEIDVNPLLVGTDRIIAVDARVIVAALPAATSGTRGPGPMHLAIQPYPERFVKHVSMPDGRPLIFRPIRPEDEPRWHDLLSRCSPDSIWYRLGSMIKRTTHAMATRYCFIDYDREIALVAEVAGDGERQLVAVVRLVADPDHETAEYAILVVDDWQGQGLGGLLTEYCLEVARDWGIRRLVASTHPENTRMQKLFRHFGFDLTSRTGEGVVEASLNLETAESPSDKEDPQWLV